MNPKKFFIVADTKNLRIGYFYAESVFKYLKRNMKTLINMVELGKVRRNRLSQIGLRNRLLLLEKKLFEFFKICFLAFILVTHNQPLHVILVPYTLQAPT